MVQGLVDGLGFEEMNQAGSQVANIWLTGSFTSQDQISGANVYGGTSVQSANVIGTVMSGGNVAVAGSMNSQGFGVPLIEGIGSPSSVVNFRMVAGSGATGAGSNAWFTFPTAFSAAPVAVMINNAETAADAAFAPAGSWAAGSFYAETNSASQDVSYIAIGAV